MYSVIDLSNDSQTIVQGTENMTEQQCIEWILLNGNDIIRYSIKKLD